MWQSHPVTSHIIHILVTLTCLPKAEISSGLQTPIYNPFPWHFHSNGSHVHELQHIQNWTPHLSPRTYSSVLPLGELHHHSSIIQPENREEFLTSYSSLLHPVTEFWSSSLQNMSPISPPFPLHDSWIHSVSPSNKSPGNGIFLPANIFFIP